MKPGKLAPRFQTQSVPNQVRQQQPREGKLATFATSAIFSETCGFFLESNLTSEATGILFLVWPELDRYVSSLVWGRDCFTPSFSIGAKNFWRFSFPILHLWQEIGIERFLSPTLRESSLYTHPQGVPLIYPPWGSPPWRHRRSHTRHAPLRLQAPWCVFSLYFCDIFFIRSKSDHCHPFHYVKNHPLTNFYDWWDSGWGG